jgi:hypothetical protein
MNMVNVLLIVQLDSGKMNLLVNVSLVTLLVMIVLDQWILIVELVKNQDIYKKVKIMILLLIMKRCVLIHVLSQVSMVMIHPENVKDVITLAENVSTVLISIVSSVTKVGTSWKLKMPIMISDTVLSIAVLDTMLTVTDVKNVILPVTIVMDLNQTTVLTVSKVVIYGSLEMNVSQLAQPIITISQLNNLVLTVIINVELVLDLNSGIVILVITDGD